MTSVRLHEPFRAVFYAPFYAALARGDFAREGVEIELVGGEGPAAAAQALLDGAADLAWSGPMRVILERSRDPACPLKSFGAVVMRDPFLLVGRGARPDFRLDDLARLRLGSVSEVTTPWWCLADDLQRAGLDVAALDRVADRGMGDNLAAMLAGRIDVAQVFEPLAAEAEAAGGAVWHAQASRGPTAYSAFYATERRLAELRAPFQAIIRGMAATLRWIAEAPPHAIAATVRPWFPDLAPERLEAAYDRYQRLGIWSATPVLERAAFDRLEGAMLAVGAIERRPGYEACVDVAVVEEAGY